MAVLLAAALVAVGCADDAPGRPDALVEDGDGPNAGPPPTIPGGVELVPTDPATVLVGTDLAFGTPLPSEQLAADAFTDDPEVAAALARRVHATDGRRLADALLLTIDGSQIFDEAGLAAFERALVGSLGGAEATDVELAGRPVVRAASAGLVALGFREGDLLTIVSGAVDADVTLVVTRQLEARARGEVGSLTPVTPLADVPAESVFVPVPTVSFAPIPPPEEEPASPTLPALAGATEVYGRYGVVAGERRTVVWVLTLDRATYPSAEALDPVLPGLVAARAEGAPAQPAEVVDRVVLSATDQEAGRSASVFRHQGLVLLVEGRRADQVETVVTAWITALSQDL